MGAIAGALGLAALGAQACLAEPEPGEGIEPRDAELPLQQPISVTRVPAPLPAAHCDVQVEGQGVLDLENDYLPHVIQCENGGANLEALKAQAVAARSVAYYNMETQGSICDSQGCQVYSCGATPQAIHYQAVEETSGLYLMYNSTLTYGFYVAGDNGTSPPSCVGVSGATEGYVTYNEGLTGTSVEQTTLGFIHDPADFGYGQNRGCMSQWGARCLENDNGYDYLGILRFYYGDDIELVQAEGACVLPLEEETGTTGEPPPPQTTGGSGETGSDSVGGSTGSPPADDSSGNDDDPVPPGGTGSDDVGSEGGGSVGEDGPALPTTFGENEDASGCACRGGGPARSPWSGLLLLVGLGWLRRRR